ncbi:MAG: molybdopterin-dependent oxidoreductase, partial [Alphaproteobacteria bacterium]
MLIRNKRGWEIGESAVTPEGIFVQRRRLVKALAMGPILAPAASFLLAGCGEEDAAATGGKNRNSAEAAPADPSASLYPMMRNPRYQITRPLTDEKMATTYNNFYEFGSHKQIHRAAQALRIRPWTVTLDGLVEKKITIGVDELLRKMPLEERLYRHRCVEAWSMTVPWSGFALKALVDF